MTPAIAVLAASGFGICGMVLYARRKARLHNWRVANAKVVGVKSHSRTEGAVMFAPVFSFVPTPGGDSVIVESRLFLTGRQPEIGREIRIIFDPANPSAASTASWWTLYFPAIWFFALAAMWIAGGLCLHYGILK